jgi:AmiR/NasT family two-component response regulator
LATEIAQLRQALATRTVAGQATGIIAGRLQVSTETAWQILRRASTDTNLKLRRVAEIIVASHDSVRPVEDDDAARDVSFVLGFTLVRDH